MNVKPIEKSYKLDGFEIKSSINSGFINKWYYVVDNSKKVFSLFEPFIYASKTVPNATKIFGIGVSDEGTVYFSERSINFMEIKNDRVNIDFKRLE